MAAKWPGNPSIRPSARELVVAVPGEAGGDLRAEVEVNDRGLQAPVVGGGSDVVGRGLGRVLRQVAATWAPPSTWSSSGRWLQTIRTSSCWPNTNRRGTSSMSTAGTCRCTARAASATRSARCSAVTAAGAAEKPSAVGGPSSRIRAWKWTAPRRGNSATLRTERSPLPQRVGGSTTFHRWSGRPGPTCRGAGWGERSSRPRRGRRSRGP